MCGQILGGCVQDLCGCRLGVFAPRLPWTSLPWTLPTLSCLFFRTQTSTESNYEPVAPLTQTLRLGAPRSPRDLASRARGWHGAPTGTSRTYALRCKPRCNSNVGSMRLPHALEGSKAQTGAQLRRVFLVIRPNPMLHFAPFVSTHFFPCLNPTFKNLSFLSVVAL